MNSYEAALRTVCIAFELTENEVCGLCRRERYVEARMWYAWLCSAKLQSVSRRINRDHATVIYYRKKLRDYMSVYPIYQEKARIMKHLYDRVLMEGVVTDEYRAYTGADEFVNDACNHECMLMRDTRTSRVLVPSIISDELVECGGCRIDYANLVKNYVWYDDGTFVGVKI